MMVGLMRRQASRSSGFAEGALQIRQDAQEQHAKEALEALRQLAIHADAESVRERAWCDYLEQVLGKPENPPAIGAAEEDGRALFAAYSGTLSEKLRRIAHSGTMPYDRGRVD